jgi:2-oxoacid:acceptor oxidoreductase delta subunit (pyruvate/2-ketoisovalerate family)
MNQPNKSPHPVKQPLAWGMTGAAGLTGGWRLQRPLLDSAKCNGCLLCWILCPDGVIARDTRAIDYDYCKGCGICAAECPRKAISMVKESEYEQNS